MGVRGMQVCEGYGGCGVYGRYEGRCQGVGGVGGVGGCVVREGRSTKVCVCACGCVCVMHNTTIPPKFTSVN